MTLCLVTDKNNSYMHKSNIYILSLFSIWFLFSHCKKEERTVVDNNLATYWNNYSQGSTITDSLIACAVGGQKGFMEDAEFPISILFYPEGNATDFQYFESTSATIDPADFSQYEKMDLSDSPIFNGYLRQFKRAKIEQNLWGRVTFIKDGNLHVSNAIRLKYDDKPTEYNPSLLAINQSDKQSPIFTWEDGQINENAIYFHALLDEENNLISGTYTFEKRFQFYDLSNVVLNIRAVEPAPVLADNATYKFVLMGVSVDNWVNLVLDATFQTN